MGVLSNELHVSNHHPLNAYENTSFTLTVNWIVWDGWMENINYLFINFSKIFSFQTLSKS